MKHCYFKAISASTFTLLFILLSIPPAWAQQSDIAMSENFNDPAAAVKRLSIDPKQWRVENGVLKTVENRTSYHEMTLGTNLSDFSIEFDARFTKSDGKSFFGIILRKSSVEGKRSEGMIYCWDHGALGYQEMTPNKEGRNIGIGQLPQKPVIGTAAAFIHFRYVCIGKLIHIYADNKFITTIEDVAPTSGILSIFITPKCDIEVDNITVALLSSKDTPGQNSAQSGEKSLRDELKLTFDTDDALKGTMVSKDKTAVNAFYGEGLNGRGLYLGTKPLGESTALTSSPRFSAKGLFSKGASIMFWIKPDFDYWAPKGKRLGDLLRVLNSKGEPIIRIGLLDWGIRATVKDKYADSAFYLENREVGSVYRGEWHHVALVVDPNGLSKLFLDGMLYSPSDLQLAFSKTRNSIKLNAPDLSDADTFILGSAKNTPIDCALDEVSVLSRPVSDDEVAADYRSGMPVDVVAERKLIRANKNEVLSLEVHPAGELPCSPGVISSSLSGTVEMILRTEDATNTIAKISKKITILDRFQTIDIPIGPIPEGRYLLSCAVNIGGVQNVRSFPVLAYTQRTSSVSTQNGNKSPVLTVTVGLDTTGLLNAGGVTARTLKNGEPYLEAGEKKMDRLSFPIDIPERYANGHPMILEITWPDDKIRSMGLYLYPKSARANDRERLEGGILAGGIYPNTGEMKTVRYIIYPWLTTYLFEARTMSPGRPAAVATIRLIPAPYPLPRANTQIALPTAHRMIGHVDEDGSFDYYIGSFRDLPIGAGLTNLVSSVQALVDYFDYTGQDIISYTILRYSGVQYSLPGSSLSRCCLTDGYSAPSLMMDMLSELGKKYVAIFNISNIPELSGPTHRWAEFEKKGYFILDRNGKSLNQPNPVHPEVQAMVRKHIQEVLRRFSKSPAFAGVYLWSLPIKFGSMDQGYDDYSIGLFEKETGIHVPATSGNGRFAERYAFLTGEKRSEWLAWRASKVTAFIHEIATLVSSAKNDCMTYVSIIQPEGKMTTLVESETLDAKQYVYENNGINFQELGKRNDIAITPLRRCNAGDWKRWWDNSNSLDNEFLFSDAYGSLFRQSTKAGLSTSFNYYFESYNGSLSNDIYKSMFQNADVKPNGRHFLREFAFNLASADPSIMLIGGQPLGSAGRDEETREFATAFRALPAKPFADIPGTNDPVCTRFLSTPEGVYVYAVNRIWTDATATITFNKKTGGVIDLSTAEKKNRAAITLSIPLKPYQLKTYRIDGGALPVSVVSDVDAVTKDWYRAKTETITAEVKKLTDKGVAIPVITERLNAITKAVGSGRLAEAHRLIFSKMIEDEMPKLAIAAEKGYLTKQAEMIGTNRYAINCGAGDYYVAKNGTLFFPDDRPFTPGGYGYIDKRNTVIRDISPLRGVDDPKLFETEAYDVEGYRFTVKPGTYTVILYLRIGYPPMQKTGAGVLNFTIAGQKVLENADLYSLCGENAGNAVVKTFKNIIVKDNILDIVCTQKDGLDPSVRLFNAIEVIRDK
ncbi:MAG: LamG-like jellyroll fold domain-containing protein [Lentisphaerota bacterium]